MPVALRITIPGKTGPNSVIKMSDLKETLFLAFVAKLPDLNQELAPQHFFALDTFTCFPKFPLELRLKFWRGTFPRGKYVSLDADPGDGWDPWWEVLAIFEDRKRIVNHENHRPLPAALRISPESRKETLKHYCVLWRSATLGGLPRAALEHPFCFSPTRDTAYIVNRSLNPRWSRAWLKHFETQAPIMFAKIRNLEIRDWIWNSRVRRGLVHTLQSRSGMDIDNFDHILLFHNRSKITLLRSRSSGETPTKKEEIQECVGRLLEYHKNVWNGSPPTVEVEGWRQMKS
jgi:hypothetical protein